MLVTARVSAHVLSIHTEGGTLELLVSDCVDATTKGCRIRRVRAPLPSARTMGSRRSYREPQTRNLHGTPSRPSEGINRISSRACPPQAAVLLSRRSPVAPQTQPIDPGNSTILLCPQPNKSLNGDKGPGMLPCIPQAWRSALCALA